MKKITAICCFIAAGIGLFTIGYFVGRAKTDRIESALMVQLTTEKAYHGQTKKSVEYWKDQCQYHQRVGDFWYFKSIEHIDKDKFDVLLKKAADIE